MGKYLILQFKRILRMLPLVLIVVAILFGALMIVYQSMVQLSKEEASEKNTAFKVALCGYTDDPFLEMGLQAVQTFDSSRFSIEIVEMEESDAISLLEKGDIAAYVVIPEGFVEKAMYGEIMPIKYVSASGAVSLVSIFKDEITRLISDILVSCQKGAYGVYNAVSENDSSVSANSMLNLASINFVEFVFVRSNVYTIEELGIANGLGLEGYLFCGLCILFLMLICLAFAPILVRRDQSLSRMLAAKRYPLFGQVCCETVAYLAGLLLLLGILVAGMGIFGQFLPLSLFEEVDLAQSIGIVLGILPIIVMLALLSFMLYELTDNLISGVLLQFFVTLAMGFVSGCMYPIFFFPEAIQKLAGYLPMGIARNHLGNILTDTPSSTELLGLILYSVLFFAIALFLRRRKVMNAKGVTA